ncbi:type IV secretion system protein [Tessaracoccus antarcticus]|uniref:type IV secretion system protein n=1 Tax=Tessaracoccus antarcticus TaxID=2479848 RepID=UPI00131472F0|nr:type IV secretion system protein [Tessaracoccus antarcticus]
MGIFEDLAAAGGRIVTDIWITICMAVWGAGLWVFRIVLQIGEWLMTPSLSGTNPDGSANSLTHTYGITLWLALMLALILSVVQLTSAVIRRDGQSLGMLLLGAAQFLLASTLMFSYAAAVVAAVGGINQALTRELLGVKSIQDFRVPAFDVTEDVVSGMVATVLLVLGLVLWVAALSHVVVLLGRSVALVVLTATAPIAAAGLLYEPFKVWFWKSFRWFHAAAFAPLLMTLMLGIGVQVANGVTLGLEDDTQKAAAMAIPAVVMILVASWSPLALFRFLAFIDPGTTSGANFRASLNPADTTSQGLNRLQNKLTQHLADQSPSSDTTQASTAESGTTARTTAAHTSSLTTEAAAGGAEAGTSTAAAAGAGAGAGVGDGAGAGGTAAAGASAEGAAAGGGASAGAVGGVAGVVAVGALAGAAALVVGFKQAGALATGVVADSASGMGSGDPSYPYDPTGDTRRPASGRTGPTNNRVPVAVIQEDDNASDDV